MSSTDTGSYAHGYDTALTLKFHASRTAATHARFILPYLRPGIHVLDCGCGSGAITLGLAQAVRPGQVTGIDVAAVEIERGWRRAQEEAVDNARFEVGNVCDLGFPDRSFDVVFAHNVLEHVGEPGRALKEMRRVLKLGGIVGLRDVDIGGNLISPTDERLGEWLGLMEAVWEAQGGHPRLGRRLRGLLHEAGFVDVIASASYDYYGEPEALRFIGQIAASRCEEQDFIEQVLKRGLANRQRLAEIQSAWIRWTEQPDAFCAIAHGEVLGTVGTQ
jgi:ubiquinone/menaquinone biosynthesis C-methylase UbiE